MIDHNRHEIGHAERGTLHLGLVQKFGGHNNRGRPPQRFQFDAVMRTARRARPSIADRGQDDVVFGSNRGKQRRKQQGSRHGILYLATIKPWLGSWN